MTQDLLSRTQGIISWSIELDGKRDGIGIPKRNKTFESREGHLERRTWWHGGSIIVSVR